MKWRTGCMYEKRRMKPTLPMKKIIALFLFLAFLTIPAGTLLHAVGPSYPGEPTIDPQQPALPLAAFGWLMQWRLLATIVALTVIGSAATLLLQRILRARQGRAALGQDKLELLARHAERLERLYRRYAELFPKQAEFWSLLAADETKHARWSREIFTPIAGGEVLFPNDAFPVAEIEASSRELDALLVKAADPACDLLQAFQNAAALEEGRSRWQLPDFFSGPERAVQGMVFFHSEILAHRERLDELKARTPPQSDGS